MIELSQRERDLLRAYGSDPDVISTCSKRPRWLDELMAHDIDPADWGLANLTCVDCAQPIERGWLDGTGPRHMTCPDEYQGQ